MNFDFILVGLMQIVGFFVQGTTGFGCTVIAAPVTNGILGTAIGVPYGTIITLPFLYYLGIKGRKDVSWKDLAKIVALCAPGILIGNKLFTSISPQTAKIGIGGMIIVIATMNIHKHIIKPLVIKQKEEDEAEDTTVKKVFRYGCLILGGVVHGAFTIGGPLITVYTLEAVKDKKKFRNTMTWLWCILNVWNAFAQYNNVPVGNRAYLTSALLIGLPMAGIGFFFGMRFLEKINRVQFLRIVYAVLMLIGVNMFKSNVPWTPELIKMSSIGLTVVGLGYIYTVVKNKKANEQLHGA
ncbi:TSUP family transporter [Psychrilyobacter atlanticus]|uniref:TSUP family transporter n=1 Tax=Psychrilyobacter atlanticus TaxID=271091 RepID=UPI0004024F1B|nr:TSUP family transporter [Psychrilyobacter atlanticus]